MDTSGGDNIKQNQEETKPVDSVLKKPQYCDLILLENCMLRCKMCYMWQCTKDVNQVPASFYKQFIVSLNQYFGNEMQIQFVGGEPLLKPGILDLIKCASNYGFFTSLTSNAYLLDRKMALDLVEARFSSIALSLDSTREDIHDYLRGMPGVFSRVQKALKYLAGYRYPEQSICVVATIMDHTVDDLVRLVKWAEAKPEITCLTFQTLAQPFFTKEDSLWYKDPRFSELWPKDLTKLFNAIDELIEYKKKRYKIGNAVEQMEYFKKYYAAPEKMVKQGGCHLGYNSLSVNSSGDIYLCFDQEPIGNIISDTIADVWESPHADSVRGKIKNCRKNCKSMINCFTEEGFSV